MARYRITQTITANGVPFRAGDEVDGSEIEGGCLGPMVRLGQAVPVEEPPADAGGKPPAIADARPPALKSAAKK